MLRPASSPAHLWPAQSSGRWPLCLWFSIFSFSSVPFQPFLLKTKQPPSVCSQLFAPPSDSLISNTFISLGDNFIAVFLVVLGQVIYLFGFWFCFFFLGAKLSD